MKERPILFSGPMVNAILDGRKTMTRRIVDASIEDHPEAWSAFTVCSTARNTSNTWSIYKPDPNGNTYGTPTGTSCGRSTELWCGKCPYGEPVDRLWVRETFYCDDFRYPNGPVNEMRELIYYRSNGEPHWEADSKTPWRPSIFMPRWASRITLEVKGVRLERLQRISAADAIAEGIEAHDDDGVTYYGPFGKGHCDPREAFKILWDSINQKRAPWASNPWVWVVEFARVK